MTKSSELIEVVGAQEAGKSKCARRLRGEVVKDHRRSKGVILFVTPANFPKRSIGRRNGHGIEQPRGLPVALQRFDQEASGVRIHDHTIVPEC